MGLRFGEGADANRHRRLRAKMSGSVTVAGLSSGSAFGTAQDEDTDLEKKSDETFGSNRMGAGGTAAENEPVT
jgi:hypothetical protein